MEGVTVNNIENSMPSLDNVSKTETIIPNNNEIKCDDIINHFNGDIDKPLDTFIEPVGNDETPSHDINAELHSEVENGIEVSSLLEVENEIEAMSPLEVENGIKALSPLEVENEVEESLQIEENHEIYNGHLLKPQIESNEENINGDNYKSPVNLDHNEQATHVAHLQSQLRTFIASANLSTTDKAVEIIQNTCEYIISAINNKTKENFDEEIKKYTSEIARLKVILKQRDDHIENLTKKLKSKINQTKKSKSSNSDSIYESGDMSEHSTVEPSENSRLMNSNKRGRPRKSIQTPHSVSKSRGRPRKRPVDEDSSYSEPPEKKSRGRPRKSFASRPSLRLSDSTKSKKSRGRPRKSIMPNDHRSNSQSFSKGRESDSESKEKKSRGRPRKSVVDENHSVSVNETKGVETDSKSDSKDKNSSMENSEPKARGRPKKISTIAQGDVEQSSGDSQVVEKKQRGRPRKSETSILAKIENTADEGSSLVKNTPGRSRGRPKKIKDVAEAVETN